MAEFNVEFTHEIDFGDGGECDVIINTDVEVDDDEVLEYAKDYLIDWDYEFENMLDAMEDDELFELVASRLGLEK